MPPAARTELETAATCRNCQQALPAGAAVCPACGAAHGEANRCPHCRAIADVEAHSALGFRCLVCGGPRVALDVPSVVPSEQTNQALQRAGNEQTQQLMFGAAGFALAGMGLLALLVTSVVVLSTSAPALLTLAAYLASVVPLATGLYALARAGRARRVRGEALRAAQVSALADVQALTGLLDARRVSEIMRIAPERAELLLAEASVAALLQEAPLPRYRVDAPGAAAPSTVLAEPGHELEQPRGRTARGDTEI
jgi:hypothetical protein